MILTKKSKKLKKTPLFEENFDIEANIIINNDYDEDINFNLYGLLRVCLLKDICLSINGVDYTYYYDKLPEKIKIYIWYCFNWKYLFKSIRKINYWCFKEIWRDKYSHFSKFIDDYIRKDEIIELINILKKDIKTKIKKQINLLNNYIDYMKMLENRFEEAKKESIFEYNIVSLTLVDRKDIKEFE